jgi:hypothetical protein
MVAEEVFVNCDNFNLILKSKKVSHFQSILNKTIRRRSSNSDFRFRGARVGAKRNILGSTTLATTLYGTASER